MRDQASAKSEQNLIVFGVLGNQILENRKRLEKFLIVEKADGPVAVGLIGGIGIALSGSARNQRKQKSDS